MNELILEELKYDLEEKIRKMLGQSKDECYKANKQAYENSRKYT